LDVSPGEGVTPGKPVYPASVNRKFSFDPKPLAVYEGSAAIKLPLRAEASAPKGKRTLMARVRVQPCNDQACFPPRTIETSIPVTIN
ncbi:MAG TPA: protein-disulfide reductase DsbD domain-containing protein, partial [Pyrinomonadaceae bacterium]|nr:protein-disulfide reductase DsbD domain-containing protein [Pyrinomonadaceae bacterium]